MNHGHFAATLALLSAAALNACGGTSKSTAAPPHKAVAPAAPSADAEAWRASRPNAGPARPVAYPVTVATRLPNGLHLYFVKRPSPIVSVEVVVRGGAASLPQGKSGLAALTARMLTEGTTQKTALQLAIAAESLGSELSHDAERDSISLGMAVLPRDLPDALALLSEVVQTPAFRAADLARVKTEWQDQIRAERQNPMRLASIAGLRAVLGTTLGAPVSGSPADIGKLDRADLVGWHRALLNPGNMAIVVVGGVELGAVTEQVTKLFGALPARAARTAAPPALPAASPTRVLLIDRPGSVQSAIFAAHPFPKRSEPGHEAREVMNSLLGGLFTSRLNLNLREQHAYTYGARSSAIAARQFGLFAVSTSVERDVTAEAIEQILYELKALRDPNLKHPILPEEIQRAQSDLSHDLGASLEHTARIANNVAGQFVHALPLDYFARYKTVLDALTPAEINQAAELVDPKALTLVVAGDRAVIESKVREKQIAVELAPAVLIE